MKATAPWFNVKNAMDPTIAEIYIIDFIGDWVDDMINRYYGINTGVTAKAFVEQLSALSDSVKTIHVHINSPGGDVFAALNIANALRDQQRAKGRVVITFVDGLAASAASVVAMAGSEVRMADNALMMIHNPYSWTLGTAAEMRKAADALDAVRDTIVATYQWQSKLDAPAIIALMDAETWMTADEAVANGFATSKVEGLQIAASLNGRAVSGLKVPEQHRAVVNAFVMADQPPTPPTPTPEPAPAPVAMAAGDVLRECKAAGFLDLAEELLGASSTAEQVTARLTTAKNEKAENDARATSIRALCNNSKLPTLADGYIKARASVDDVREHLLTITARLDTANINANLPADHGQQPAAVINSAAIYAQRNGQAGHKEK